MRSDWSDRNYRIWARLIAQPGLVVFLGLALFVAFWWIVIPVYTYIAGTPGEARIIETWQTDSTVSICFWSSQLAGIRLEITPQNGKPYQVKKYCREELVFNGDFALGSTISVRYFPFFHRRVIILNSSCDFDQVFFITLLFLSVGVYAGWVWLKSRFESSAKVGPPPAD